MHTNLLLRRCFIFAQTFFRCIKDEKTTANPIKTVIGNTNKNNDAATMKATPVPRNVAIYDITRKRVRINLNRLKNFIICVKNEWIAELFNVKYNQPVKEFSPKAFAVPRRSFNVFLKLSLFIMVFLQNFKIAPYCISASPRKCA